MRKAAPTSPEQADTSGRGPEAGPPAGAEPARPRPDLRSRWLLAALFASVLVAAGAVLLVERSTRPEPVPSPSATAGPDASGFGPYPSFGATSVFAADVRAAPLDPRGPAIAAQLARDVANNWGGVAPINVAKYGTGYAVAGPDTPRVDVKYVDCQKKGATPPGLYDGPTYFAQVPMPADAVPAPGSDGHLAVWDPTQDKLWEFWAASKDPSGSWRACWGGRIDDVSTSAGQFRAPYGVSASGLAGAGFMIRLEEAKAASIDHAMGLVVMEAAPGHGYPANRDDGTSSNPAAVQEGTRLRLDPAVDVEALPMNSLGKAVARAAQKHGFIVCDKGGAVAVVAETGDRLQQRTGSNPWSSMGYGGDPSQALKGFPWDRIQVVAKDWGKPAGR